MIARIAGALLVVGTALIGTCAVAQAQSADLCASYRAAVEAGSGSSVPVVPERLLANSQEVLACLVPIIGNLKDTVKSPTLETEIRNKLLSATGAIRAIMTRLTLSDEKLKAMPESDRPKDQETLNDFIKAFRLIDNLDTISVLTYGARNENYDMRLNAVLILGNIIDDSTICVPLVQLYDIKSTDPAYINGRANLLSIVSVVAPWATAENYENIKKAHSYFSTIPRGDPTLATTIRILDNIEKRYSSQTSTSNKSVGLQESAKQKCKEYKARFASNPAVAGNVNY